MKPISHDRQDESLAAKACWFKSLTLQERMDYLVAMTDLILENNPGIMDRKNAEPPREGVRVVKLP